MDGSGQARQGWALQAACAATAAGLLGGAPRAPLPVQSTAPAAALLATPGSPGRGTGLAASVDHHTLGIGAANDERRSRRIQQAAGADVDGQGGRLGGRVKGIIGLDLALLCARSGEAGWWQRQNGQVCWGARRPACSCWQVRAAGRPRWHAPRGTPYREADAIERVRMVDLHRQVALLPDAVLGEDGARQAVWAAALGGRRGLCGRVGGRGMGAGGRAHGWGRCGRNVAEVSSPGRPAAPPRWPRGASFCRSACRELLEGAANQLHGGGGRRRAGGSRSLAMLLRCTAVRAAQGPRARANKVGRDSASTMCLHRLPKLRSSLPSQRPS